MNRIESMLSIILAVASSLSAHAWTEAETNAVVRELGRIVKQQVEWEACASGDDWWTLPPVPHIVNYEDLFMSGRESALPFWKQWTPEERQMAFEQFVAELPQGSAKRLDISETHTLLFCLSYKVKAAVAPAREIISSTNAAPISKAIAARIYVRLAPPSKERDELVSSVLTNKATFVGGKIMMLQESKSDE